MNLNNFTTALATEYGIDDPQFAFELSKFAVANNWFGKEPVMKNGMLSIDDSVLKLAQIKEFCETYYLDMGSKIKLINKKMQTTLPETNKVFVEYCKERHIDDDVAYTLADFLLFYLPGEIMNADDNEIAYLLNDAFENISKGNSDVLTDFINWIRTKYKPAFRNTYFMNPYSQRDSDAYSQTEYLRIMYYLFNENHIRENEMYKRAANSKNYTDTWLFIALHFISAIRNTDLVRIPHPRLPIPPEDVLKQVDKGIFSAEYAKSTLYSITWRLRAIPLTPNKTKRISGVANIKFEVPESAEELIGTLFALAEAHLQIQNKDEPVIKIISSYQQINRYMGEEIGDLFLESNFKSKAANKSFMQMIQTLTDSILENQNDGFKVKGYILAALARSHKGSYGEFAKTTVTYLKDAKMNGYTPEFVARELFERGVMSFAPEMLLKMLHGEEYGDLSIENQTKAIQALDMSPFEVESAVKLSREVKRQSADIAKKLYKTNTKEEILKILHNIGNGTAVSKQGECLCLMTAMKKECPYIERTSCPGCEYEISTKSTMFLMVTEYNRLKKLYEDAPNDIAKQKYHNILANIVLPTMDEMLNCMEERYGENARAALEVIIENA